MSDMMKGLSLWQPWASLCVIPRPVASLAELHEQDSPGGTGPLPFKTIETRSWRAPKSLIGQRIAIHAAKRSERPEELSEISRRMRTAVPGPRPLGAVVGTAVLVDCVPIHEQWCQCPDRTPPTLHGGLVVGDFGGCATRYMSIGIGGLGREILGLYREDGLAYSRTNGNLDQHPWMVGRDNEDVIAQIPLGHYACGRWAWLLADAHRCEPIPWRGAQGLWNLPSAALTSVSTGCPDSYPEGTT